MRESMSGSAECGKEKGRGACAVGKAQIVVRLARLHVVVHSATRFRMSVTNCRTRRLLVTLIARRGRLRTPHLLTLMLLFTVLPQGARAQNEAALRAALEGRMLTVKIDMPGTSKGIDVFPQEPMPVDWREVAQRLKDNGTSLKIGQSSMITKVVVKKDSHIEVQLGGGGYGTFGDNTGSSVSSNEESDSKRERTLRDSIKATPNGDKKKQLEKDLSSARGERERENSRTRAAAEQATAALQANLRVKRVESGSRFNVRFRHGIPAEALTADGIMRALAQLADIAGGAKLTGAALPTNIPSGNANALLTLKKGLSIADVETLFGPANTAAESKEGSLTLMRRIYAYDGKKLVMSFVNGVLIDYVIAPQ